MYFSATTYVMKVTIFALLAAVVAAGESSLRGLKSPNAATSFPMFFPGGNPVFLECVNDGEGELIDCEGTIQVLFQGVSDGNDGLRLQSFLFSPKEYKCVGLETGDTYNGVGSNKITIATPSSGTHVETIVSVYKFISRGAGNNFSVKSVTRTTINANGDIAVDFDKTVEIEC